MTTTFHQAGGIAFRQAVGDLSVLLISTSSGKHLTIPKGLIDPGFDAVETVHNEAWEEAGIRGDILQPPVGVYRFAKWGGECAVTAFALRVMRSADHFPEAVFRRRQWFDYREAARCVKHADLGQLILKLPAVIGG